MPIRMYLTNYPLTPTMRSVEDRFSVKYYLNLVITDVDDNRYFKQQVISYIISYHLFYQHRYRYNSIKQ